MGSMEFKLFSLCVVRCSVLTIFSWLKNRSSDALEQGAHRQILITSFTADHLFGVLALEKNLVPKFVLVNVFKIEINLHKSYIFDVLVNNIHLFHVSEYRKMPNISSGLIKVRKHFLVGLYSGGLYSEGILC